MQFLEGFSFLNLGPTTARARAAPNFAKIQFDGSPSPLFFLSRARCLQSSTPAPPSSDHHSRNAGHAGGHPFSVGGGGDSGQFVNVAFDGNENSVVVINSATTTSVGMENGNVIIKSGSVTAANGRVERSLSGSPSVPGGGGSEDGERIIFGLRDEFFIANSWR